MKTTKLLSYLFYSWLGRRIYGLRLRLETLNDKVDLKAGKNCPDWILEGSNTK